MKINVSYNKLPNGKISAFIQVVDKGEYLTDKIFMRKDLDLTGVEDIKSAFKQGFPLNEREVNHVCFIGNNDKINVHVDTFISILKKSLKEWQKLQIPDSKEYQI